jgi:hypothetical protein
LWSCHTCAQFQQRGIPATLIVTDAFQDVATSLMNALGHADVPILVTGTPVIYLNESQIQQRIDGLLDGIISSFGESAR